MPQTRTSQAQAVAEGDLVEVVLRGKAQLGRVTRDGFYLGAIGRGVANFIHHDAEHVVSVTKIAPPWQVGDVILVGNETRLLRRKVDGLFWIDGFGTNHAPVDWYDETGCGYTALVRGGQVVAS